MSTPLAYDDELNTTQCSEQDIQELISYIDELEGELARKDEIIARKNELLHSTKQQDDCQNDEVSLGSTLQNALISTEENNDDSILDLKKTIDRLLREKEELKEELERFVNENNAVISITDQSSTDYSEESTSNNDSFGESNNPGEEDDELIRRMESLHLKEELRDHSSPSSRHTSSSDESSVEEESCADSVNNKSTKSIFPKDKSIITGIDNDSQKGENKPVQRKLSSSSLKKALIEALDRLKQAEEKVALYQKQGEDFTFTNANGCRLKTTSKREVDMLKPLPPSGHSKSTPLVHFIRRTCVPGKTVLGIAKAADSLL